MRRIHERHGESKDRLYKIWRGMLERCYYQKHDSYALYGGRGVIICDEWKESYIAFSEWAKSSGYRIDKSIDRIDPDGNYEPSNCRWSTGKQQSRNRRPMVVGIRVSFNGENLNLSEWARKLHINYTTLVKRYNKGLRGESLFRQTRVYKDSVMMAVIATNNGKAKITPDQVDEIKKSNLTGEELSRIYKVAQSTISMIRSGKRR